MLKIEMGTGPLRGLVGDQDPSSSPGFESKEGLFPRSISSRRPEFPKGKENHNEPRVSFLRVPEGPRRPGEGRAGRLITTRCWSS